MDEEPQAKRRRELSTQEDFYRLGKEVQNRSGQKLCAHSTEDRRFREYFGASVTVAMIAWSLLNEHEKLEVGSEVTHLLWAMYFVKCYPLTQEGCAAAGTAAKGAVDPKTWKKWVWPMIWALADLESEVVSFCVLTFKLIMITNTNLHHQIDWSSRKKHPDHDTHVSVDCTDCKILQKGRAFASFKFAKKSGLRYEVGVGIMTGEIVWINGGFPCGLFNDLTIFRASLATMLDPQERVEADDGYATESPYRAKVTGAMFNPEEARVYQKRVQGRHETVNARFKGFKILSDVYRHDVEQHGYVFRAVAVLVQLSIKNGDPLFETKDYECAH